jgi:hypothetical protein
MTRNSAIKFCGRPWGHSELDTLLVLPISVSESFPEHTMMIRHRLLVAFCIARIIPTISGFVLPHSLVHNRNVLCCLESSTTNDSEFYKKLNSAADKLEVETTRAKLEQDNTNSFLKRRPVKLPYDVARRWVQANLGCDTQEEFDDMVANGNLRTPYIPKRPEEYYTLTREWISWEHFLKGIFDDANPSGVRPATGILD